MAYRTMLSFLSVLPLAVALAGCDNDDPPAGPGEGTTGDVSECDGEAPACLEACGGDIAVGPAACQDGSYVCEQGVSESDCGPACGSDDPPACLEACGGDIELEPAVCEEGAFVCHDGVNADECASGCTDDAPTCLEACGSDIAVGVECIDASWICADGGVAADDCDDDCESEAPPCLEACGSDVVVGTAECVEDRGFVCSEGAIADDCPDACPETGTDGCDEANIDGECLDPDGATLFCCCHNEDRTSPSCNWVEEPGACGG